MRLSMRIAIGEGGAIQMAMSDNAKGILAMSGAMAVFTINDALMKLLTQQAPLFQSIFLRGCLTSVALIVMARMMGQLQLRVLGRDRFTLLIRCIGEAAGTVLYLAALTQLPLATVTATFQAMPLAVTLGAAIFFRERVGLYRSSAIILGFIGVLIIIRPGPEGISPWALLALASVAACAMRDLVTRAMSARLNSMMVAIWSSVGVTLTGGVGMLVEGVQPMAVSTVPLLMATSALMMVGYVLSVGAMRVGDVGIVSPCRYTALIWGVILGWAIFGALPDGPTIFGASLVVATGVFSFWRERRQSSRLSPAPVDI